MQTLEVWADTKSCLDITHLFRISCYICNVQEISENLLGYAVTFWKSLRICSNSQDTLTIGCASLFTYRTLAKISHRLYLKLSQRSHTLIHTRYIGWPSHCCGPARVSPHMWRHNCNWQVRAMAINGMTKGPRTPLPRWVSAQLLYLSVSAWRQSWWCSQNLCRPFPQAVRLH